MEGQRVRRALHPAAARARSPCQAPAHPALARTSHGGAERSGVPHEPRPDCAVDPVPLFTRVATDYKAEHNLPDLDRDDALGRLGKENLKEYFGDHPLGYVGMTFRKMGRMWSSGVGDAMSSTPGRLVQILLVLAGLAGLMRLAWSRRWEAIAVGLPIATVTAVAAITLAPARRNEILMMLVLPLAAVALDALVNRTSEEPASDNS